MKTLIFTEEIKATPEKIWQVLWNDYTYRKWVAAFEEGSGSYAVTDWKEGSEAEFLTAKGDGMFSKIISSKPNEYMAIRHLGVIKNHQRVQDSPDMKGWENAMETYTLEKRDGNILLTATLESPDEFVDYFNASFPKALAVVKELSETP